MPKFFRKKSKPYNLRSRKKNCISSTPKSKVDVSVEFDLPFDESEIAPELRREQSPGIERSSGVSEARPGNANKVHKTSLEPVEPSHEENISLIHSPTDFQIAHCSREKVRVGLEIQDTSDPDDFCNQKYSEKGKEKELVEENITVSNLTAGGQQVSMELLCNLFFGYVLD